MSSSFPFFSLAKKYNADYAGVLLMADLFAHDPLRSAVGVINTAIRDAVVAERHRRIRVYINDIDSGYG
jgi:hypothetical protein